VPFGDRSALIAKQWHALGQPGQSLWKEAADLNNQISAANRTPTPPPPAPNAQQQAFWHAFQAYQAAAASPVSGELQVKSALATTNKLNMAILDSASVILIRKHELKLAIEERMLQEQLEALD
jgi:hypothetical protein